MLALQASQLVYLGKHTWVPELRGWKLSRVRGKGGGCTGCAVGVRATQRLYHGWFCHCITVYLRLQHD